MSTPQKKIINLKAKLSFNGKIHPGIIENISRGTLYVTTSSTNYAFSDFDPGKLLNINFQLHSGDAVCLLCKVKWSYKTPPHGITESLGIEIIDADTHYEKLLRVL